MKIHNIVGGIAVAVILSGCGDDIHELSSGTYVMSDSAAVSPDNCNLGETFPNGTEFSMTISETSATYAYGAVDATRNPVSAIDGNILEKSPNKVYEVIDSASCTEVITITTEGSITDNDEFEATMTYQTTQKAGSTGCIAANLGYKAFPCSSTLTYTAKKK